MGNRSSLLSSTLCIIVYVYAAFLCLSLLNLDIRSAGKCSGRRSLRAVDIGKFVFDFLGFDRGKLYSRSILYLLYSDFFFGLYRGQGGCYFFTFDRCQLYSGCICDLRNRNRSVLHHRRQISAGICTVGKIRKIGKFYYPLICRTRSLRYILSIFKLSKDISASVCSSCCFCLFSCSGLCGCSCLSFCLSSCPRFGFGFFLCLSSCPRFGFGFFLCLGLFSCTSLCFRSGSCLRFGFFTFCFFLS